VLRTEATIPKNSVCLFAPNGGAAFSSKSLVAAAC